VPDGTAAERRRAAIGSWSAMVGALVLARLSDDLVLSDEMLRETRAWLEGKGAAPARGKKARSR
jgi:TetR/AcrR family transcriptional repressor of nem operon